jgi:hypothetical protein
MKVSEDFEAKIKGEYGTILADPPWRFANRTGKMAPEHRRLSRYTTLTFKDIEVIPVSKNLIWHKIRKDGGPDGRGVGFYFRNTTEIVLFGIKGNLRTLAPGRKQVNIIRTQKREHSKKPDELYDIIEDCSPGPFLELFARGIRKNWDQWGNEVEDYKPTWPTYANHSQAKDTNILSNSRASDKKTIGKQLSFFP